jgi:hypothetical protein
VFAELDMAVEDAALGDLSKGDGRLLRVEDCGGCACTLMCASPDDAAA